jgi:hypothetical protein
MPNKKKKKKKKTKNALHSILNRNSSAIKKGKY